MSARTETPDAVDAAVADLRAGEAAWGALGLAGRRRLLEELRRLTVEHADEWVRAAGGIKGLPRTSALVGEEWLSGPYPLVTSARALADSLDALERGGSPVDGFTVRPAPGGRSAVQVLPHDVFDRLLLSGYSAEVWSRPGLDADQVRSRAGLAQRTPGVTAGVCAVLGAGNILSIAPLDVLYALHARNQVVALKLNPVADPMLPVLERIFAPYITGGFVRFLTGGPDVGRALLHHQDVAAVHMTGSAATHDAIVFGEHAGSVDRKPTLLKPITSELGGVSPTVVVPGRWSKGDLRFQAKHVATHRLHNGGYNCIAAQAVVVSSDWPQKGEFLRELERAMDEAPGRDAWYPGSDDRTARAREAYPLARRVGPARGRTLLLDVPAEAGEQALTEEFFAPVLAVTELPGLGADFLRSAVTFVNDSLTGTLGANLVIDPVTERELGASLEESIADLRYGTVAVNAWTGLGYLTARASWGAFPGHTIADVQSGIGVVHNALLLEDPERTVVRGPFRILPRSLRHGVLAPKPPWFVDNRTARTTARRLTAFAGSPGWRKLPAIFASALRG